MIKISKAQILHVLSAVVIVPFAAVASPWLAKHFPGLPHYSPEQLAIYGYVGATAAFGVALHYLHGWQVWERDIEPILQITDSPTDVSTLPADGKDGPTVARATVS